MLIKILSNKAIYIMAIPVLAFYIIFIMVICMELSLLSRILPCKRNFRSSWAGLRHFKDFFGSFYFKRVVGNTLIINIYALIFGFPAPIILALLLNEITNSMFKRTVQTVSYLPHFISTMVICSLIIDFTAAEGLVNQIIEFFGGEKSNLLLRPELFRPIYISTNIWQNIGWGSIIYLSALTGIDQELYEAAIIDGASRGSRRSI